eukprot:TRINITY_DN715_c0_g1_i1.p1 TRINITY_DN715_c0_g1~~TRINITY_DN715_c0_g1_i1.p1  ORF type:complete len:145 (+),score=28.42 TRINITY_DN715_c0_g1_i1:399-833(+)
MQQIGQRKKIEINQELISQFLSGDTSIRIPEPVSSCLIDEESVSPRRRNSLPFIYIASGYGLAVSSGSYSTPESSSDCADDSCGKDVSPIEVDSVQELRAMILSHKNGDIEREFAVPSKRRKMSGCSMDRIKEQLFSPQAPSNY